MSGQIRRMTQDEQNTLLKWAAAEGWNPGVNDAACFWNLDPDGFLAIALDGSMAGGGAVIRHNETFGFMGLFIVHPEYRGRQLGRQLWNARRDQLQSRLKPGATIGLDGVDDMVSFYEQGGFRTFTRHRRFELSTPMPATPDEKAPEIIDLQNVPAAEVHAFDRTCFPGDRDRFLRDWITQPGALSLGFRTDLALQGFGVMRPCQVGWKIGPLFAKEFAVAERLFRAFAARAGTDPMYLDAPDNNPDALRLCRSYAMSEVFGCTRMYLGPVPDVVHDRIYGIATLEVG
jgi:GNAT superfamily N-acetyltransferase